MLQLNFRVATLHFKAGGQHYGLPLCLLSASLTLTGGMSAAGMGAAEMGTAAGINGCSGNGCSRNGCCRRQANSHRLTQPELTLIRILWVGLSRCFPYRFLCRSSQWCPGRQQVISTEGPLLPTREWFDPIHMNVGVGTYSHDVQFRTPPVLDPAPAEDTVSQVDQVTNV